jgi:hypothetical protein
MGYPSLHLLRDNRIVLLNLHIPLFLDTNNLFYATYEAQVFLLNVWGTIAYNLWLTLVFLYLGCDLIMKKNHQSHKSNYMAWKIGKSLAHYSTSSFANGLFHFSITFNTFFFDYTM